MTIFQTPVTPAPAVTLSVILLDEEVGRCKAAVRLTLGKIRNARRRKLARGDQRDADALEDKFDRYLDLYERLGGDPDDVPGVDDEPSQT